MYKVSVEKTFSAAHYLRDYKGRCEKLHGHNWKVRLSITGRRLLKNEMLFDFTELKKILTEVLSEIDHVNLNKISPFDKINPTAENIAKFIFDKVKPKFNKNPGVKLYKVSVWESESSRADYYE